MIETKLKGIGKAHGKIILGGEHSVVQGKPAIVLPLPFHVKVETTSYDIFGDSGVSYIRSDFFEGSSLSYPIALEGYFAMIYYIQSLAGIPNELCSLNIFIDSDIPIGSGFGSSAAVALAIARSVFDFYEYRVNKKDLFEAVKVAEKFAHGNPSGIDMFGAYSDEALFFVKGKEEREDYVETLFFKQPLSFLIVMSGITIETKEVVEKVGMKWKSNPHKVGEVFQKMEQTVIEMSACLKSGDYQQLGKTMTKNHKLLRELGVSSRQLDMLVSHAIDAGALGCKLTGKGIGGAVIALTEGVEDARQIGEKLLKLGAVNCYIYHWDREIEVYKV
jgi:mevalonate kinase